MFTKPGSGRLRARGRGRGVAPLLWPARGPLPLGLAGDLAAEPATEVAGLPQRHLRHGQVCDPGIADGCLLIRRIAPAGPRGAATAELGVAHLVRVDLEGISISTCALKNGSSVGPLAGPRVSVPDEPRSAD